MTLDEALETIRKQAAQVDELQEEMISVRGYIAATDTLVEKIVAKDAQIVELEAAVDCAHANGQHWLQQIHDLKAQIAELQKAKLDAYMTEYHPGKIANND